MNSLDVGHSISLGMCLPAVCSTDDLESIINKVIHAKTDNFFFEIPKTSCQFEEYPSELTTVDLLAM